MALRCYTTGESMAVVMIHPQSLTEVEREKEREMEREKEKESHHLGGLFLYRRSWEQKSKD